MKKGEEKSWGGGRDSEAYSSIFLPPTWAGPAMGWGMKALPKCCWEKQQAEGEVAAFSSPPLGDYRIRRAVAHLLLLHLLLCRSISILNFPY